MDLGRTTRSAIAILLGATVATLTLPAYLAGNAALAPVAALSGIVLVGWGLWRFKQSAMEAQVESRSNGRPGQCK